MINRRDLLRSGLLGAGALTLGPVFWRGALADTPAAAGAGPYGPLGEPDANGLRLPGGFRSRLIAQGLVAVAGTAYTWHASSDGQATYPAPGGGFVLVSNSEEPAAAGGGASAIRFAADGRIVDAYRILSGTTNNCAGGRTPWATWLSCEETGAGRVWECDPFGEEQAVVRPAMGVFKHEAAAVDPDDLRVYLTEDEGDGCLYRFTPDRYPDLASGLLEVASVQADQTVLWRTVPDPSAESAPTRRQVPGATTFERAEGIWFDAGTVYVATTSDSKVHAYDTVSGRIEVLYDGSASKGPLQDADNLTVSRSGDIFVGEDAGNLEVCIVTPEREVAPFVQLSGPQHRRSEVTGPIFDPSGMRFFFSSQGAFGAGAIYEITGPFRQRRAPERFPPRMRVHTPDSVAPGTLLSRGLPVRVRIDRAAKLSLSVQTQRTRPVRGSVHSRKARQATLVRRGARVAVGGKLDVRLRPGRKRRRKLRERRIARLVVVVHAEDAAGNRRRITKEVAVRRPRRRRRRPGR